MSDSLTDEMTDVDKPETTSLSNVNEENVILSTTEEKSSEQSQDAHIANRCEDSSKDETRTLQDMDDKKDSATENTEAKITAEQTTDEEVLICTTKQDIPVENVMSEKNKEVEDVPSCEVDTTILSKSTKHKDEASAQSQTSERDTQHIVLNEETLAEKQSSTLETPPQQQSSESDSLSLKSKEESSTEKQLPTQKSDPHTLSSESKTNETERKTSAQETSQQLPNSEIETSTQHQSSTASKSSSVAPSKDEHAEHVTYTEDGSAIYTDPETKYQYKWCTKANNWTPLDAQTTSSTSTNPYENEHYKWCQETQKWIPKQAQVTETEHYKWDAEKNQWIAKKKVAEQTQPTDIVYDIDEDGQRIYTDKDGTVYFWDVDKNAWFPKIDDDFMARYQMSYGFIDNTSEAEKVKEQLEVEAAALKKKELQQMTEEAKMSDEASQGAGVKRKAQQEPPKWFEIDPERNTKVYVSNLPLDITLDEFTEVMSKCGMIMRDPQTQKFKLKLYTEADGQMKGDGLCDYIKVESVDLALKILDEYDLRGHKMRVQRAQFQMRGEYNPALKPKRKKKDKEKLAKIKEKLFDWRPEKMRGERSKHEKTVIIKNLFHPELFEKEVQLILDYQNDLREECSKCGTVRKVVIYDRHSEGVAQINMASPEEADLVIQMMQGRFFGKRQLTAEHWDGKTKYKIEETEEEIQKRLNKWDTYLEAEENKSDVKPAPDQDKSPDNENETTREKSKVPEEDVVT